MNQPGIDGSGPWFTCCARSSGSTVDDSAVDDSVKTGRWHSRPAPDTADATIICAQARIRPHDDYR